MPAAKKRNSRTIATKTTRAKAVKKPTPHKAGPKFAGLSVAAKKLARPKAVKKTACKTVTDSSKPNPQNAFVLRIRPLPESVWHRNIKKSLGKDRWQKMRSRLLIDHPLKCDVCSAPVVSTSELDGHELWTFDTEAKPPVARVHTIQFICRLCHDCIHFARSSRDKIEKELFNLRRHFCRVNATDEVTFELHFRTAMREWERLTEIPFLVDHSRWIAREPENLSLFSGQ